LVTDFNPFLYTDIKFVKGEIIKYLFSKIQLPWNLNSRGGFILMVLITAITIVKFIEADGISSLFCKKKGTPKENQRYRRNREVAATILSCQYKTN